MNKIKKLFSFLRITIILNLLIILTSIFIQPQNIKRNLILITIDTLRADYIGVINNNIYTPFIDSIAKEGVLFTNVFTTVPLTLPSHISILTGTYPFTHGVRNNGQIFNNNYIQSIASILKKNGYNTYAITASYVLHSRFGLSKDFDYYSNVTKTNSLSHSINTQFIERKADEILNILNNILPNVKKPFFIWIHFFDPHAPYNPPPQFSHGSIIDSYKGEIEYTDATIGKFMNLLKMYRLNENLILCITSDHGESLGEHKENTHGHFIYNSTIHIPLIIKAPNLKPTKLTSFVSTIDIAPTLLELLNLSIPSYMEGNSLIPIITNNKLAEKNIIYSETLQPLLDNNWAPLFSLISNNKKYIYSPKPELYDLQFDFNEHSNILTNKDNQIWKQIILPYIKFAKQEYKLNSQTKEALLSLGYASGSLKFIDLNSIMKLPDPKDTIDELELIHLAMDEINKLSIDNAYKILFSLYQKNTANTRILYLLSLIYKHQKDYNNALFYMKKAADINTEYMTQYYLLSGEASIINKKLSEAENLFLLAIKFNPYETAAYYNLSQLAYIKKDLSNAKKYLLKTIELEPENLAAVNNLSTLYISEKKFDEAEKLLLNYLSISSKNEIILNNLIKIYQNKKDYKNEYKYLKDLISINPNNEKYYLLMINCCNNLNNTSELIEYRFILAELYIKNKQFDKALEQLNTIIKIDSNNTKAIRMIKQIQNYLSLQNN